MTHYPRKRFGQHFLKDESVIDAIVAAIAPQPGQHLVEIGPGLGALTQKILPLAQELTAIELDRDVIPKLSQNCAHLGKLAIHSADVLKFDFASLVQAPTRLRVFGNLPYNISTPLIFHLFEFHALISDMCFMLQKEVVERMAAKPGSKTYGRLSIMVQFYCRVESLFLVPPSAFNPPPQVDSAIVRLIPHRILPEVDDLELFTEVVKLAFNQRRKTLRNGLRQFLNADEVNCINAYATLRAEQLSLADFIKISNNIAQSRRAISYEN